MEDSMEPVKNDVHETLAFKELDAKTKEAHKALSKEIHPLAAKIFDENADIDERIKELGEAVSATLLAYDHRGGYPNDSNGREKLIADFKSDFGYDIEEYSVSLGFKTFRIFLESQYMEEYIKFTINDKDEQILRGRPFTNDLLKELLEEQKIGHDSAERKANEKVIERKARMQAMKINPETTEFRLRIYKCMHILNGEKVGVSYQDVQTEYENTYNTPLDKKEIKKYFGTGKTMEALKEYTNDDIQLEQNDNAVFYLKFKEPYIDIEARYKKLLEEWKNLPDAKGIADMYKRADNNRRYPIKSKKVANVPIFGEDTSGLKTRSALFSDLDNPVSPPPHTQPKLFEESPRTTPIEDLSQKYHEPKKQQDTGFTNLGNGNYSSDDSDDEGPVSQSSSTSSVSESNARFQTIRRQRINSEDSEDEKPVRSPPPIETQSNTRILSNKSQLSPIRTQVNAEIVNQNANLDINRLVLKAFIYGILKSAQPLQTPVKNIIKKAELYMRSQSLGMSEAEIDSYIHVDLGIELQFHSNGRFVTLGKTKTPKK